MALPSVFGRLQQHRVVLASASPRRREILGQTGLRFEVVPSQFKETLDKAAFASPAAYAVETAKQKSLEVARRVHQKDLHAPDVVIGADTVVALEGSILEKPVDKQDAYRMLSRLSGKEHSVFTGVTIVRCHSAVHRGPELSPGDHVHLRPLADRVLHADVTEFFEETRVTFSQLSQELLWEYVHSGEPMDKAGGYGIQALGGMLVERVDGDFLNVVGFPLNRFCKVLGALFPACPALDLDPEARPQSTSDTEAGSNASLSFRLNPLPVAPDQILRLVDGFKASQVLFTACRMRVFDLLTHGPRMAADLALEMDATEWGTRRLLDACTALGLLRRTKHGFANTAEAGVYLVSDGAASLHSHILHHGDAWAAFGQLEDIVQGTEERGSDAVQMRLGHAQKHLHAMLGLSHLTARLIICTFDLSRFHSACLLGGSTEALAWQLARQYPHMTVMVLDLPHAVEQAHSLMPCGGDTARVSFVPGDIFRDCLPKADLYVLSLPLHWSEDRVHQLLHRVSDATQPGTGLLVADEAPAEGRVGTPRGLRPTLDLLVQPEDPRPAVSGRWLLEHGFRDVQVVSSADTADVMLCFRAGT